MNVQARPGFAPGATAMASAAAALAAVVGDGGCTAEEALHRVSPKPEDRAATRAILAGTLRWFLRLAPALESLLKPGQEMHPLVRAVLCTALYQVEYSRAPAASVVNIAVDAVRVLGQGAASGFVNALLRRFLREHAVIMARVDDSKPSRLAHPRWMLRRIREAWPDAAEQIVAANNEAPPMTLRVNLARTTREVQLAALAAQNIASEAGPGATGIVLEQAADVNALPGFAEGLISVQDAGAQLAAELLDAQAGEYVLDACAAPGGKTGHILERAAGVELIALDCDSNRLERVQQNLTRLGLSAQLKVADLLIPGWWDGRPFDRILLDAPCSGTGVIRRHPDIKLLRRQEDIFGFAATQLAMLLRCATMLKPGGLMVYATCSILLAENTEVVERFLKEQPRFSRVGADRHVLPKPRDAPGAATTDGFYYARLRMGGGPSA
ncbi:MAG: 16S rRNA (cytosine(967)-C(5))-methyltransferase RsmB [Pseudomonadota bacterium]